jgi:hypothetical protein
MHANLLDTLAARRAAHARRRQLEHELAGYSTPSDRLEIEAIVDRYSDEETHELRAILAVQSAA